MAPLIATLVLDPEATAWFDGLRRRFFPAERLVVGAHVTLFHALPGEAGAAVAARAEALCRETRRFAVAVSGVRFLGRGVAFALHAPEAAALRREIGAVCAGYLTAQDRGGWAAHVTIQNKVPAEEARRTEALLRTLDPPAAEARGIALWHYRGGPWEVMSSYEFAA